MDATGGLPNVEAVRCFLYAPQKKPGAENTHFKGKKPFGLRFS